MRKLPLTLGCKFCTGIRRFYFGICIHANLVLVVHFSVKARYKIYNMLEVGRIVYLFYFQYVKSQVKKNDNLNYSSYLKTTSIAIKKEINPILPYNTFVILALIICVLITPYIPTGGSTNRRMSTKVLLLYHLFFMLRDYLYVSKDIIFITDCVQISYIKEHAAFFQYL